MKVRFNEDIETIDIKNFFIENDILYIYGENIPSKEDAIITIYNDDDDDSIVESYTDFLKLYESSDEYVAFVKQKDFYNTFLLYDDKNLIYKQITLVNVTTLPDTYNGIIYKSGYSKECRFPENLKLFDNDGINRYKIENGQIVETTEDDKKLIESEIIEESAKKELMNLDIAIQKKLTELNDICSSYITDGIDYNGEHYSYELSDQNNIYNCIQLANLTGHDIPYHADGEGCKLFSLEELMNIYMLQEMNLTKHITYTNQLKQYVKSLTNIADVEKVVYGQELSGTYLKTFQSIMEHSQSIATSVGKDASDENE